MIQKYFSYIVIVLLIIIMGQGFLNSEYNNDELYMERINKLSSEKIKDLKKIDSLNTKLNTFKDEVHEIDSITSNYSNNQLDSFYTDFFR